MNGYIAAEARGTILRAEVRTPAEGAADYEVIVQTEGKKVEIHIDAQGAIADAPAGEAADEADEDDDHEDGEDGEDDER